MKNKYLPADQVAEMRRCYKLGHKIVDLARHFGVHPVAASRIVHYKTYKNVSDDAYPLPPTAEQKKAKVLHQADVLTERVNRNKRR